MIRRALCVVGVSAGLSVLLGGAGVLAHHSFTAEYDNNKPITLKGTVTKMLWVNPHGWLHIDAKGPDGKVVDWAIEFGGPTGLYRRGWRPKDLPVGAEVTVDGWLAKDGSPTINASRVTLPDGRRLFAGSSGNGAPPPPTDPQ